MNSTNALEVSSHAVAPDSGPAASAHATCDNSKPINRPPLARAQPNIDAPHFAGRLHCQPSLLIASHFSRPISAGLAPAPTSVRSLLRANPEAGKRVLSSTARAHGLGDDSQSKNHVVCFAQRPS